MPNLFSSTPKPPTPPPVPVVEDTSIQQAKVGAAQRRNKAAGYASTILSQLAQPGEKKATFGS